MISIGLGRQRTATAINEFHALFPSRVKKETVDLIGKMNAILLQVPELGF